VAKVAVLLYGALARAAGEKRVEMEADTILEALEALAGWFGDGFRHRLFDDRGTPKRFISIYVNGRDIRFLNRFETRLNDGDTVSVIPAVSRG